LRQARIILRVENAKNIGSQGKEINGPDYNHARGAKILVG
jgi:hypothetical protein